MRKLAPYTAIDEKDTLRRIQEFDDFHYSLIYGSAPRTETADQRERESQKTLAAWLAPPNALLVILEDEISVGLILVCYEDKQVARIEDVFVDCEHRGKGLASFAIKEVEKIIKEKSECMAICLEVSLRNLNAVKLYHKLGYTDLGLITMRKQLGESKRDQPIDILGLEFKY